MELLYLGTAAAEAIPALFCECPACRAAERLGGKDLRTRAGALLNGHVLLDLTPDIFLHKLRHHLDLSRVDALVVTHSHTDHFDAAELTRRSTSNYCHIENERPLAVYGNEKVCGLGAQALALEFGPRDDPSIRFCPLKPYDRARAGELSFTALPARHDPQEACLVYLIEEDGGPAFLYANDTEPLDEEACRFVEKALDGKKLAGVSMDCTFGTGHHPDCGHMGLAGNLLLRERLAPCTDAGTRWYVTHFSHNCGLTHTQLCDAFVPAGFTPAFDGLRLEF